MVGGDGAPPRNFEHLSDAALWALVLLFTLVKRLGRFPVHVRVLLVFLLGKPAGGFRPIVLFPAILRL